MSIESELLGLTDNFLRLTCGQATHQHFKGGLYRYLGPVKDSETGEQLLIGGIPQVAYEHLYPHKPEYWVRGEGDFFGYVDADRVTDDWPKEGGYALRFRKIA